MALMDRELVNAVGDPAQLEKELQEFRRNAQVLSSRKRHLIARFPKRWVAIYNGDVAASAGTLTDLLREMDERGIPRGHTIVRYIDKNPRKLIL